MNNKEANNSKKKKRAEQKGWGKPYGSWMCEDIIKRFKRGETREEFCAAHDIADSTFQNWIKKHKDFREAQQVALMHAKAYMMRLGHEHLIEEEKGAKINTKLYQTLMNLRFNIPEQRRLKLEGIAKAKDVESKLQTLLNSLEKEQITTSEVHALLEVIKTDMSVKQHNEFEKRLEELENANKIGVGDDEFKEQDVKTEDDI